MPFPHEPLHLALLYLRSFLEVFILSGLGLQIVGQAPRLRTLLKFALVAGIILALIRVAPLDPAGQLAVSFVLLIFALMKTRRGGLFISTSAVVLGLYLLLYARWLLVQLRQALGFPLADLSTDILPALLQEAPVLLLLTALVCLISFLQHRTREVVPSSRNYGRIFQQIEADWRKRLIPTIQLFLVIFLSYIINVFYFTGDFSPAANLVPFSLSLIIVACAFFREYRLNLPPSVQARFSLLDFADLVALAVFIHFALYVSGGMESVFKLFYIPFILAHALKKQQVFGFFSFLFASVSLVSLATVFNSWGLAWNLEPDLLYIGIFFFTFVLTRYYSREESKWQQVLNAKVYTDHFTGLYNYHYVRDFLDRRSDDELGALYLMVVDLGGLKIINDRFGHPTGDKFLGKIGRALQQVLNPEMIAARYDGDKFIVMVKDEEEQEVLSLAERIREALNREAEAFLVEKDADNLVSHFTVSIGISRSFNVPDSKTWLLTQADQNLQEAKGSDETGVIFRDIDDIPLEERISYPGTHHHAT